MPEKKSKKFKIVMILLICTAVLFVGTVGTLYYLDMQKHKQNVKSALNTGSGTTKFLREDGTWQTPAYTTNTDEKLKIAAVTSGTTYYPIVAANSTAAANR